MPQPLLPVTLGFLLRHGKAEAQDLVDHLGVSKRRARSMLREARRRRLLVRVRFGVWRLAAAARRGIDSHTIAGAGIAACAGSG